MPLYKIGRNESCDIILGGSGVSRKHAELLALDDGRFYLTDCASRNGTYILRDGERVNLRQAFVSGPDIVCFGNEQFTVARLLGMVKPERGDISRPSSPPKGNVKRNPETGEIVSS